MKNKQSALQKKFAPITNGQLKAVVWEYANYFPDWTIFVDGTAIVRRLGPIRQIVWFQKMRSAAYRPMHGISSVILPEAHIRMLPQTLNVKHREVNYRQHQYKIAETIDAMKLQFQPSICKPLDIEEVFTLCKSEASSMPDTANNMAMLAILAGWLGYDAEVINYCQRIANCELPELAAIPEWEERMRIFGHELMEAAQAGNAQEFLRLVPEAACHV